MRHHFYSVTYVGRISGRAAGSNCSKQPLMPVRKDRRANTVNPDPTLSLAVSSPLLAMEPASLTLWIFLKYTVFFHSITTAFLQALITSCLGIAPTHPSISHTSIFFLRCKCGHVTLQLKPPDCLPNAWMKCTAEAQPTPSQSVFPSWSFSSCTLQSSLTLCLAALQVSHDQSHTFALALPLCSSDNFSANHQHSVQEQPPLHSLSPHLLPSYHHTPHTQRKLGFSLTQWHIMHAPLRAFSTGSIINPLITFFSPPLDCALPEGRGFLTFESLHLVPNSSLISTEWRNVLTLT